MTEPDGAGLTVRATESAEIDKLVGALAKASLDFAPVLKDRTAQVKSEKGSYSYNYSDLASVLKAVTPALAKNGLVLIQRQLWDAVSTVFILESRLAHESGQWISATYPLPTAARPQEMGSAQTYARRYTATAILGIASEEDDDGNAAEGNEASHTAKDGDPLNQEILETAEKLRAALGGNSKASELIKAASAFDSKDGPVFFTDPRGKSEKWRKGTLTKLKVRLESLHASTEALGDEKVPF